VTKKVNVTKSEVLLLAVTAAFLCGLLVLSCRDRAAGPGITVETAVDVPPEALTPDFSPRDLNAMTVEELAELPGIGPALAERIAAYRTEHGPFRTVEELLEVSGIGEKKLEDLRDRVTVAAGEEGE